MLAAPQESVHYGRQQQGQQQRSRGTASSTAAYPLVLETPPRPQASPQHGAQRANSKAASILLPSPSLAPRTKAKPVGTKA